MRTEISIIIIFLCFTAACITPQGEQVPIRTPAVSDEDAGFIVPVYSNGTVNGIPYEKIISRGYADIPDKVIPGLSPDIQTGFFSGNVSNVARIALNNPCIHNLLNDGGFVLGADYYIPFHGNPAPRLMVYFPKGPEERRVSAFVNETSGQVTYLMIEYRYDAMSKKPGFDPFIMEGWAGGRTCEPEQCSDIC